MTLKKKKAISHILHTKGFKENAILGNKPDLYSSPPGCLPQLPWSAAREGEMEDRKAPESKSV